MKKKSIIVLIVFTLLSSCATGPKIETLFVGEGIMQYFVFPTTLKSENSKISIDITYRGIKDKEGFVTVNFSYLYENLKFSDIKNSGFIVGEKYFNLFDIKILFQEKRNRLIRYTSKLKESEFLEIVKSGNPSFYIETDSGRSIYPATGEFKDKLKELYIEIF